MNCFYKNRGQIQPVAVFALTLLFFVFFFFWPIMETLKGAFLDSNGKLTFAYFIEVFRNPIYMEGLLNAFLLGIASLGATALIAIPLALLAHRFTFPGRTFFTSLLLVPMILPPFVGALGMRAILGQQGALNALLTKLGWLASDQAIDWLGLGQFWGIVILNALHLYPILYLNVIAALANVDPALEEAASNLGCTGIRRFFRVTFPLIMPGVFAGGILVFIWAFTELGVPLMFDYSRVTSVQIFNGIKDIGGNPFPFALVVVMLISSTLVYLAGKFAFGQGGYAMISKGTGVATSSKPHFFTSMLCIASFSLISALAILPHIGVICIAFSTDWYQSILPQGWTLAHFQSALGHNLTLPSIENSLKYAGLATLIDLVLGIAIAHVVVRSRFSLRGLLDIMAMLPLAVPGLILAFGYLAMTQPGKWFAFMNPTIDPLMILVIAYGMRRLPFVVRSVVAGFQQTSETLEEAACNLGSSPFRVLRRITLPLIAANLLAGALLAFSFAMLEVADSLILAQRQQDFPITKAIFELSQLLGEGIPMSAALGVWAMAFLGVTILGVNILLGKKLGALFRI